MKKRADFLTIHFLGGVFGVALLLLSLLSGTAVAVTPAGTVISNQATATYSDSTGNAFSTRSNPFNITVSQVAAVSLTPVSQSFSSVPGNAVQFPHVVQNTGNGTDTVNLTTATGGAVTLTSIEIFRDDNGDGLVSAGEPLVTSLALNMGQSRNIVVRGVVPGTAISGQSGTITLTAGSVFNPVMTASSTDTANVVSTAVISLSKVVSASSVNPGGTLDYTINYTNIGIASTGGVSVTLDGLPVTRHVVRDVLPANTTLSMFLGTPIPSGGERVYHSTGAPEDTYVIPQPPSFDAVAYLFPGNMVSGQSGTFSFRVTVATSTPVGAIANTSVMKFHNGSASTTQTSNTTSTSVNLVPGVNLYDTDLPLDDIQLISTGNAGATLSFMNEVKNMGNGEDRFNMTVTGGNFPAGTVFILFKGDGITPLQDTNADGVVDTGLLNAGATSTIIMKATLPANATNSDAPFSATVTATSVANATISNGVTNQLSAIVPAGIDLTNTSALPGAPGAGPGPEGAPVVTVTGSPGATVNIDLHVNNTGPGPDNFNLEFSATSTPFTAGTLPAGITAITFFLGDGLGNPTGGAITNTGSVTAGSDKEIIARVTVGSTSMGGTNIELFFRGISPVSTVSDMIHDRLTVSTVRGITLAQNQSNQTASGSATTYPHILTNTGNVTEPLINLTTSNSAPGFVTTIYLDNNGDGIINGSDAVITSVANLVKGASVNLIARVATPSSAANGTVDMMTLTATPTGTVNTLPPSAPQVNVDTTTLVTGNIVLTLAASPTGPQPPTTVVTYTITYQNTGAAAANGLIITDAVPVNTTYLPGSMKLGSTGLSDASDGDPGTLVGGTKGSVQFTIGTVGAAGSGSVSFQATID